MNKLFKSISMLIIPSVILSFSSCSDDAFQDTVDDTNCAVSEIEQRQVSSAVVTSKNWLSFVDSMTLITNITIPGTHDSGATKGGFIFQDQKLTISDQLNSGIRFLDIRCRHIENVFTIHHDKVYMNINFGNVLNYCENFLDQNPSEFIIVSVKKEYDDSGNTQSFEETFYKHYLSRRFSSRPERYFAPGTLLNNYIPTLKDVRGKIIFLFRENVKNTNNISGIYTRSWQDNRKFNIYLENGVSIKIQDKYRLDKNYSRSNKWTDVKNFLDEIKNTNNDKTYNINFTSATASGIDIIYNNPKTVADNIRPQLKKYLQSNNGHFGIILLDFANSDIVERIYKKNF